MVLYEINLTYFERKKKTAIFDPFCPFAHILGKHEYLAIRQTRERTDRKKNRWSIG